ncbi:hypothetical protein Hanom_Chr05g00440481 [Helianthus anomalus]
MMNFILIVGLNCCITHALKANPVICIDMLKNFWLSPKVNRSEAEVLKKLFPPYWRPLVHVFLLCISENKGGLDQLNQIKTSAMVALVNNWAYNFSAFVFENMKRMLENPKKKFFMPYPRFYPLEKHGKFGPVVQQVLPPKPLNTTIAKEQDVQFVGVTVKPDVETEILVIDDKGTDSDVELIESEQAEVPVRELPLMNYENLVALIGSLKDSLGNPPPVIFPIKKEQAEDDTTDDAELESCKNQRVEPEPIIVEQVSPVAEIEPIIQAEPQVTATAQENVIPDSFDMAFPKTTTKSELGNSSGVRFDVGSLSGEMKVFEESDSDDDDDVDVVKLQKQVVVLQQDSILKDAQIASLQAQVSNKDQVIDELQSDVNMLMSTVFNLNSKLEKNFGSEFANKDDDPMNIAQKERTAEEKVVADAEREADLNEYLAATQNKQKKKKRRRRRKLP